MVADELIQRCRSPSTQEPSTAWMRIRTTAVSRMRRYQRGHPEAEEKEANGESGAMAASPQEGIGGSDAAAVLGLSPWKSNVRLWEEKTGLREPEDISDKEVVRFGKESEAAIRRLFALDFPQYKVTYDEFGMIANEPDCPFIFATLDGELTDSDGRKGILEIKTTEIRRSLDRKKWDGQVPDYYYAQIVHQLLATGYDFAILKARIRERGEYG